MASHRAVSACTAAVSEPAGGRTPAASGPILITTKLRPPPLSDQVVLRSALLERLSSGSDRRLTLVAGPAGFGKTTLLASWHEAAAGQQSLGWLTLDEHDSDPVVLWSYVIAALGRACPAISPALTAIVPGVSGLDRALPLLINELCRLDAVTLVLDDCHWLSGSAAGDSLGWFIRRVPDTFRLVLATRTESPWPLGAMRAHGEMLELTADELRFTTAEADAFLNERLGLGLTYAEISGLVQRTEGWPAGLSLAAGSLRRATDRHGLISRLGPATGHMADFLMAEVLAAHEPAVQALLLRCSILDRLNGPLCDAVLDGTQSGTSLEALSRTNLFVVPVPGERGWYRVSPVFGQFLRAELQRREPGLVQALHQRAASWHRDAGTAHEAIRHAVAAGAYADAADLILASWVTYASDGRHDLVLAWIRQLPAEAVAAGGLLPVEAWLASLSDAWQQAGRAIAASEHARESVAAPGYQDGRTELTERELRVLKLLNSELSVRGIGRELFVSYNTVHSHVQSIYRKLGSSSRSHALSRARELELL